jgi:hypothetical protein
MTDELDIVSVESSMDTSDEAPATNYYLCTVLKVGGGADGSRTVGLTGGPFTDPGGTFYNLPAGVPGDAMFAVALAACSTQQAVYAFVDTTTAYGNLSALHLAPLG